MLSHVTLGIADYPRAVAFYRGLMELLGLRLRFEDAEKGWACWQSAEGGRPLFLITAPFNGEPASPGNGVMVAWQAVSRVVVDQTHAYALASGGADEGAPALRPQYHSNYYGAYFRDPDGNKLCVVCHTPKD